MPERQDDTKLLYLPKSLHARLRAAAANRRQSINSLILEACGAYLAGEACELTAEAKSAQPHASEQGRLDVMQAEIDALRADLDRIAQQVVEARRDDPAVENQRSESPGTESAPPSGPDTLDDERTKDTDPTDPAWIDLPASSARPTTSRTSHTPLSRAEQVRRADLVGAASYVLLEAAGRPMERDELSRLLRERGVLSASDRLDQIIHNRTKPPRRMFIVDFDRAHGRIGHNPAFELPDRLRREAAGMLSTETENGPARVDVGTPSAAAVPAEAS